MTKEHSAMKPEDPLNFSSFCINLSVHFINESSIFCFNFRFLYMTTQFPMLAFSMGGRGCPPEAVPLETFTEQEI